MYFYICFSLQIPSGWSHRHQYSLDMKKYMMFCCIAWISVVFCTGGVMAVNTTDSLVAVLQKQREDTNRINLLNELAWTNYSETYDYNKALEYAKEALTLSQKLGFRTGEATAYRRMGGIFVKKGEYQEALNVYDLELKIQQDLGDKKRLASCYMQIGSVFYYTGNYPVALENYLNGLKIAEEIRDVAAICKISNNVALVYNSTGDYQESLKYYTEAMRIYEETGDKEGVAKECIGIGNIYFSEKNFTDALIYFRKALKISEEIGKKNLAATCIIDIGEVYTNTGNYNEALKYQFSGLKIAQEIGDQYISVHINKSIGWTYFKLKQWDEARKYLNISLEKSLSSGLIEGIENSYYRLSLLDSATGRFSSAFENYKQYILYRDSIMNVETARKIAQQKMQIEFDKMQKLEKSEQAKKDFRQSIIRYSILGILLIASFFLLIVFRQRNKIRKEKKTSEDERMKAEAAKNTAESERQRAESEKERSDELLLNILPAEVADEIKRFGHSRAKTFSMVTVLFTDFKDFTIVSERYSAELLVAEIDYCFSAFDMIIQKYRVEKIKTIGDSYMCVGGMPVLTTTHAIDVVSAALEIRNFMASRKKAQDTSGGIAFELRLGIHTGPVVAGIVGLNKYAYDIWGNTVNLAARMEQCSEAGRINISGSTFLLVKDKFNCSYRGKIKAKNAGEVEMYFVE